MKTFQAEDIRNLALVGHGSCGKTMLNEAILATAGTINRIGSITAGSTVSDYRDHEKRRQMSASSSLTHTEWQGKKLNIIDTPGGLDFISEALAALRVAECAVVVVNAAQGVDVGTEKVWGFAEHYGLPKILVVNGLDHEDTDFQGTLEAIQERFGSNIFPMVLPINPGPGFNQLLDVLRNEVTTYETSGSGKFSEDPASGAQEERVKELHRELIEFVAEADESLLEKFFENDGLSEEEMREGLRPAVQMGSFVPLFCTSATHNIGVARLMDFIAKFTPSPAATSPVKGTLDDGAEVDVALGDEATAAFVFKTLSEPHVGELSFFRVYAGHAATGEELVNTRTGTTERIGQIFVLNGKERTIVPSLQGGDLGAFVKLKDTATNDTLCFTKRRLTLPAVDYPKPNIHGALRLKAKGDEDKIAEALSVLHKEDPTFLYRADGERKQTIISGQGEIHLDVLCELIKTRYHVEIELIEPRVPYRETIHGNADARYRHKKQTGGAGQFAEVWMRVSPNVRDSGVEFKHSLVGQNVDRVFVPSVEKGVMSACVEGVLAGYHVVDVKIDFYDGKQHPVDSKDIAFQIAGKHAFKQGFTDSKPCLLEPIYDVEIRVPDAYLGDVMGDISSRRGRIQGMDADGGIQIVKAQVPEAELYRYSSVLRALTRGRGLHAETFSHYEEMPRELEQKVIAAAKAAAEESH